MSYIDLAFSIGIFILFFGITMMLIVTFFLKEPSAGVIEEFQTKASSLFDILFSSEGSPSNWEDTSHAPSELGLVKSINRMPIIVKENAQTARTNEPVTEKISFDENCLGEAYNTTFRVYDGEMNAVRFQINKSVICSSGFLNETYVRFLVNSSAGQTKTYWIYYYNETDITPSYSDLTISTGIWSPAGGDSWSESTESWSRYGGVSASAVADSTNKWRGDYSIKLTDSFGDTKMGLEYNPASDIDASSYSYIDAWIYVDDMSDVSVNVSISNSTNTIQSTVSGVKSDEWYHFERSLDSSNWDGWDEFTISNIDYVRFYLVNSTAGITRTINVDEFHFEIQPLTVEVYPAQNVTVVSGKKVDALSNFTFDELRKILGEDYKFRVEIAEG